MDTLHEVVPFRVIFTNRIVFENGFVKSEVIEVKNFTKSPIVNDLQDNEVVKLEEFRDLTIELKSINNSESAPTDAALYVDGIDILENIQLDTNEDPYIPVNEKTPLYLQVGNEKSYPWIPGDYLLKVIWDGEVYYSIFKIKSLHLDSEALNEMRLDLEKHAKGLAREMIRKKVYASSVNLHTDSLMMDQFIIIKSNYRRLMYYLEDIIKQPLYDIEKQYSVVQLHKVKNIDSKTNKWIQSYKGQIFNTSNNYPKMLLSPFTTISLDINVNRWLKVILQKFSEIVIKVQSEIEELKKYYKEKLDDLKKYGEQRNKYYIKSTNMVLDDLVKLEIAAKKMEYMFHDYINKTWLRDISLINRVSIPLSLSREKRYRFILQLFRDLNKDTTISTKYLFDKQWKTSDVIYEYWCFIQTLESLYNIGYSPISGWIYDLNYNRRVFIPSIPDGTTVQMENDSQILKVVFNKSIPRDRILAKKQGEYFWSRSVKNKPDIRIDVFSKNSNEFLFTIIIDAKYRNSKYIWDKHKARKRNYNSSDTMFQILEYGNKFIDIYNDGITPRNVVKKVIILCPTPLVNGENIYEDEDFSLTLIRLNPNTDKNHFQNLLMEYLIV